MLGVAKVSDVCSQHSNPQRNVEQALFPAECEAAARRMFLFNWRLLASAVGVVVAALVTTEFHINPAGYLISFAAGALFWRFGFRNIQLAKRSDVRASYCLVAMAQILVAVSILTTLTYLATSIGLPLAGVVVNPGDLVVGDADGVMAIPPAHVETAIRNAEARIAKEAEIKRQLDQGKTLYDVTGVQAMFDAAGIVEIDGVWNDR